LTFVFAGRVSHDAESPPTRTNGGRQPSVVVVCGIPPDPLKRTPS
jgi:hypothetical protein